jgi:hypothetical protein
METENVKIGFSFSAKLWKYSSSSSWYFITIPENLSIEIRTYFKKEEEGWGRLKTTAQIKSTSWKTSVWFDKKHQAYLLPIKKEIRLKLNLKEETEIQCTLFW